MSLIKLASHKTLKSSWSPDELNSTQFNSVQFNSVHICCMPSKYEAICLSSGKKGERTECSSECLNFTNEDESQTQRTQVKEKVMVIKDRSL